MQNRGLVIFLIFSIVLYSAGCGKKKEATKTLIIEETVTAQEVKPSQSLVQAAVPETQKAPITERRTLFGFEQGYDGFEIPSWVEEQDSNAGKKLTLTKEIASEGQQSLCLEADFPGGIWSSGMVELEQYLDLSQYREISVDVYVPKDAPLGLMGKIVLTVGEDWRWTEMSRSIPLVPGEWITISASLEPGSIDWKRTEVNDAFKADVRKIVVRIESNKRPVYAGPIYIDNIRVGK